MVPANMVGGSSWEGVVSAALKRDFCVGRNSDMCGGKAQENVSMSQVGERKGQKVQYVITNYTNPQQSKRFVFFYLLSYIVLIFYLFVLCSSLLISFALSFPMSFTSHYYVPFVFLLCT
jgi:hypothetical protein